MCIIRAHEGASDITPLPRYIAHVIKVIRAYARVPNADKVVAWKKAATLLSWFAAGRSSEVSLSSWDFSSWHDEFDALAVSWFEFKLYQDSKVVVLAAGATQYTCPLLLLGDIFALGLYAGVDMTADRTSYIFSALASIRDPGGRMSDIISAVLPGTATKAMEPYVVEGVPHDIRADSLRPGAASTLAARMPKELGLAVTGHATSPSSGESSHYAGYVESVTNSVAFRLPGAQVLGGWPAPPWGHMTRGPRPASLDVIILGGPDMRPISLGMLDTLADNYFLFVQGVTLPSFLVAGKLRKFIHAALATAIMWYPERVTNGEDATLTRRLCEAYIKTEIAGSNVHATITMHAMHLRRKFEIDNLHIASAPAGMLGATSMPGSSASAPYAEPLAAVLSAVQNLGSMVSTFHADAKLRFGSLEHRIIALERRFDASAVRAVGSVMGAAAGSAGSATGGVSGGAMLGVTGGALGSTSGAADAIVPLGASDVVSVEATVSAMGSASAGGAAASSPSVGGTSGSPSAGGVSMLDPSLGLSYHAGAAPASAKLSSLTFAANVVKAFESATHENTLAKQDKSDLLYCKSIIVALLREDERRQLVPQVVDGVRIYDEGRALKIVLRVTSYVIVRLEKQLSRTKPIGTAYTFKCSTVLNSLKNGAAEFPSAKAEMEKPPTPDEFARIVAAAEERASASAAPACLVSKRALGASGAADGTVDGAVDGAANDDGDRAADIAGGVPKRARAGSGGAGAGAGAGAGVGGGEPPSTTFWQEPANMISMMFGRR